jgi:hypothetical protein
VSELPAGVPPGVSGPMGPRLIAARAGKDKEIGESDFGRSGSHLRHGDRPKIAGVALTAGAEEALAMCTESELFLLPLRLVSHDPRSTRSMSRREVRFAPSDFKPAHLPAVRRGARLRLCRRGDADARAKTFQRTG